MKLILQHDETDCGAACISMILSYYGKDVPVCKIRNIAGTDSEGTSGVGILKAAEKFGMSGKTFISPKKSFENITFPAIFHWKSEHYVIVSKLKKNKAVVFDPAEGIKRISLSKLQDLWTGVFFVFTPKIDFQKESENLGFYNFVSLLAHYKRIVSQIFCSSIILTVFSISLSFFFRFLIDEVLYSQIKNTLNIAGLCYLIIIIFQALISFCRNELILHLGTKIDVTLISDFFYHLLRLPLSFFSSRKTGEILARLNDISIIKNAVSSSSISLIIDSVMIVIGGVFLIRTGGRLVPIIMIPVFISAITVFGLKKIFRRKIKELAVLQAEKNSTIYESINGISTIKALATEERAFKRCEPLIVDCGFKELSLGRLSNIQKFIEEFVSACGTLAMYWLGSFMIFDGVISLGQLIAFSILSNFFIAPLSRLLTMQAYWQEVAISTERLSDILDMEEEYTDDRICEISESIKGDIEFRNVSFGYGTRKPIIKDLSLKIPQGAKVAFVGMSGSGKSTLIKLLMNFYKCDEGNILVAGRDIQEYKIDEYRKCIGYVPQECLLFTGTVQENILWGCDSFDNEKLKESSRMAQAYEFIEKLPEKFQSIVGEQGATLSGGERQRLALARVFTRNCDILILDEATSNLDSVSEREIMNAIYDNSENRTVIIVAHKLATIKRCDCIYVFENGYIVEHGNHSQLLQKKGTYAKLWHAQNSED